MFTYQNTAEGFIRDCEEIENSGFGQKWEKKRNKCDLRNDKKRNKCDLRNDNKCKGCSNYGDFSECCKKFSISVPVVLDRMRGFISSYYEDSSDGYTVGVPEGVSWIETFRVMKPVIQDFVSKKIPADIALEYIETAVDKDNNNGNGRRRIDMMIGCTGKDGKKIIFLFELKQWSAPSDDKNDPKINDPVNQLRDYCAYIIKNNNNVNNGRITVIPVVWLYNMEKRRVDKGQDVKIFFKGEEDDLIKFMCGHLECTGNVFSEFRKGENNIRLHEHVTEILSGTTKVDLKGDQKRCFDSIMDLLNDSTDNKKKVIYVSGGAGSGKSIVALRLLKEIIDQDSVSVKYVIPENAPLTAYKIDDAYKEYFCLPGDLNKDEKFDFIIADEAHNLYKFNDLYNRCKAFICFFDEKQRTVEFQIPDLIGDRKPKCFHLHSQFRCNHDDGYLTFIDNILNNENNFPVKADRLCFDVKLAGKIEDIVTLYKYLSRTDKEQKTVILKVCDTTEEEISIETTEGKSTLKYHFGFDFINSNNKNRIIMA